MMALVTVLFVLPMAQVATAFRHEAVGEDSSHICWQKCCSSKCGNTSFHLPGDLARQVELHDCVVKLHEPQYHAGDAFCEETCTIFASEGAKTIQVERKSGKGEQQCKLQSPVDGLCQHQCCHAKCTDEAYELNGTWQLQDCSLVGRYEQGCEEKCTVVHSGKPQHVQVLRRSGPGSPLCIPQESPEQVAADFIEQLEKGPLRDGWYIGKRGGVQWPKVKKFLKLGKAAVTDEHRRHGFSREVSGEVKDVAIIGDLHGQLFNLIAYLVEIKKAYQEKGYSSLDGSSLLVCDPRMQYIFLGDYLDRGERAVELLLLLLAYKARGCLNLKAWILPPLSNSWIILII
ncbi:BSL1 [Symbiodinium sp. CCMP2592]|nr:BSL1 [Symbiodinium sp. CCMP2592]